MTARPAPLNHVAISMPRADLDDAGRRAILDFYGYVFGWTELPDQEEPGDPLILATGAFGQFVYLLPSDEPMCTDPMDHFGVLVDALDDLDAILGRASERAAHDERVRVIARHSRTTHGPTTEYTLTSGYVGFVLPMMVEIQHLARHERRGP
ncbi:MAG: hypothetical protein ACXVJZ_05165 [Acidimicrobiia bacterium]